jgi:hypothetical protein
MGRFIEVRGHFPNEAVRSLIVNTSAIRSIDEEHHTVDFGDIAGVWVLTEASLKRLRALIDLVTLADEAVKPAAPYVTP